MNWSILAQGREIMKNVLAVFFVAAAIFSIQACQQNETLTREVQRTKPSFNLADNTADDARTMIQRYADAWLGEKEMVLADTETLGFEIEGDGGGEYHVLLLPDGTAQVVDGIPEADFTVVFKTDIDFLRRLDRGELNVMTALGRARMSDTTPLDFRFPPGFQLSGESLGYLLELGFHFWNREWPEVIPFGDGMTRFIHGANSAIFYYEQGLRTSWYQIEPGQHINQDEGDQVNPFPSLFIMTRGRVQAKLDGVEMTLEEGNAVLVPAGMTHQFWAAEDQYGEFVLVMFGQGA
jgi:mannose-6-phosphate isomerase-like protein (cupin superfamily)